MGHRRGRQIVGGGCKALSNEIAHSLHGYTSDMNYSVGSRIRVRLYSGKIVEAEINGNHEPVHWPKIANRPRQRDRFDQSRADYRSSGVARGSELYSSP
jgi:hypothetical protein